MLTVNKLSAAVTASALALGAAAHAGTIYKETFDNPGNNNRGINSVGWQANYTDSATVFNTANTSTTGGPINATFSGPDNTSGIFWHGDFNRFKRWIWWTQERSFGDIGAISSFSFALRNAHSVDNRNGNEDLHLALRINNAWYVTEAEYNNATDAWQTFSVSPDDDFMQLTFTSGSLGTPGASVTLPGTGEVTAIGFYDENLTSTIRVDDVTVFAVPEPGTLAGLGVALGLLANRRR